MSLYLDRKYLLLTSARLRNFKQKNEDLFNFSCPFCGDSEKNRLKARGYISKSKKFNGYIFTCHNCNVSTNFDSFLKHLDTDKHKEYFMEKFKDMKKHVEPTVKVPEPESKRTGIHVSELDLPKISSLPDSHYARQYVTKRLIPTEYWDEIFFAADYKKFLDDQFPDHGKDTLLEDDPRLVLCFTNLKGEVTNVSGRSLTLADQKLRYIVVKVGEGRKLYGLHRLNLKDRVYVTEGQFDSMFVSNAVAAGDSALNKAAGWLFDTLGINPVLIFDNEPRNRQIVQTIRNSIVEDNWDVCILPNSFPGKDINEAVLAGTTQKELMKVIESNTFSGLTAQLKLSSWSKV
jgi:transcription elongation factor Elf1